MTTIEKAMVIVILVVIVVFGFTIKGTIDTIQESGGIKQIDEE